MSFSFPVIALEEHFLADAVVEVYDTANIVDPYEGSVVLRRCRANLVEVGHVRLNSMKESGVTLQVLSHVANSIALDLPTCIEVNDQLARRVATWPQQFSGFATLPMKNPSAAAVELRRCIEELGFKGALIDNNTEGRFYDHPYFWEVFHVAEELDVPIYLHPTYNDQMKALLCEGNYPDAVAQTLATHAWGWHSETALHVLRLFAAGLFDKHPRLKLIIGHMGEMLPFQLDRVCRISSTQWPMAGVKLERQLRQVWDENIWVTTSGMFTLAPMATLLRQCKPDRILFSVDYPFSRNEWGASFLNLLKESGIVSDQMLEDIAYRNAEKLLKIKVSADTKAV
ncbi:hypothetical protein RBB50_005269 [Rhinocladiella similis]